MLQRLIIRNAALISHLDIEFAPGFNVLTGETGAGKSIIIDAINFVSGERTARDFIKTGEKKASVEAFISCTGASITLLSRLADIGVELEDDTLFLSRELTDSGRNVCRINGALVSVNMLKSITDCLIDIHGQHEHQSLLDPKQHIDLLDSFGSYEITEQKLKVRDAYDNYHSVNKRLLQGFMDEAERLRRIDLLSFQIQEIEAVNVKDGELEELMEERMLLVNSEKIMEVFSQADQLLEGEPYGALNSLRQAARLLEGIAHVSKDYEGISEQLNSAFYEAEEAYHSLRSLSDEFEFDPRRLEQVERRIDAIVALKRKYGQDYREIQSFLTSAKKELDELLSNETLRASLEEKKEKLVKEYKKQAEVLTSLRRQAAKVLEENITKELNDLGLINARFEVCFEAGNEISPNGVDQVEFYLSANKGEPVKPLSKVASGGEASRVMLALKSILARADHISTMIFDEIDTGVSGRIAGVVGEKMLNLSRVAQVICVTHLAQIAAMADAHYLVKKSTQGEVTSTTLTLLSEQERVEEVARIMDVSVGTAIAKEHAKQLLDYGESLKNGKL